MVKGVNKTVIEVKNTGSKVFDKIVFYVSPTCGNLSAKNLNRAIKNFTFDFDNRAAKGYKTLRRRVMFKRRLAICLGVAAVLLVVGITLAIVL